MIDLSIVIPSIRIENWPELLENIAKCCTKYSYEVIFVGPYAHSCINESDVNQNVKFVRDLGSPNRCQQIGLTLAEGKYVTWLVDDYDEGPNRIDDFLDLLQGKHDETVIVGNYDEAGVTAVEDFSIKRCYGGGNVIHPSWQIFNVAFMSRTYLEYLGGFDCQFDVTCIGHTELAVRAQLDGCSVINAGFKIGGLRHLPDTTGDHGPVHHAQLSHDHPLFDQKTQGSMEQRIRMDNWKNSPAVWDRRFR